MGNKNCSPPSTSKTLTTTPPPNEAEDIIIKCHYTDIAKLFRQEYAVVWHDPNINSQTNTALLELLKTTSPSLYTFTEWEKASNYIKSIEISCLVITSGNNGKLLAESIDKLVHVSEIYVFCANIDLHKEWAQGFQKIALVENYFHSIFIKISQKINSLRTDFPAFAPAFDANDTSTLNHLNLYLQGFRQFNNRKQAKQDFLNLANTIYQDKNNMHDFHFNYDEYDMEKALTWYTKQSFFYQTVNNCLRLATIDAIQYARLPLRDVEDAIKQQFLTKSKSFNGLLYRGTFMLDSEWESLMKNLNKEVEMFGFLSTSSSRKVAIAFLNKNPQKVFITIIIPPYLENKEQGFAEVKQFSVFPDEEEVLFNVRSRFTILETSIEIISENFECRHLVLFYGALGLRKHIAENEPETCFAINPTEEEVMTCSECEVQLLSQDKFWFVNMINQKQFTCMDCMKKGNSERKDPFLLIPPKTNPSAPITCQVKGMFMEYKENFTLPFYGSKCTQCNEKGNKMYRQFRCTSCDLTWCDKCFDPLETNCSKNQHPILLENRPFTFWMQRASPLELERLKHQEELANSETTFVHAQALYNSHKYQEAEKYYRQYLSQKENKDQNKIGNAYNNLARIYEELGNYDLAIHHYEKALEIFIPIWGELNPLIADLYSNKGGAYSKKGALQLAFNYSFKALDIHNKLNLNSFRTGVVYNNIGNMYEMIGEYKSCIEYCLTAYKIWEKLGKEKHPFAANALNNIGLAYKKLEMYEEALKFYHMSLKIKTEILGQKHPTTGDSYNNIGMAYVAIQDFENAATHLVESLKIRQSIYGEYHSDTYDAYANLGYMHLQMGDLQNAIQYYTYAAQSAEGTYGPDHHEAVSLRNNLENLQKIALFMELQQGEEEEGEETG